MYLLTRFSSISCSRCSIWLDRIEAWKRDFPFGYDKFLSDQILESFAERHPDTKVTLLRCCSVLGPGANPDISRIFCFSRPIGILGYNPPFQFLHEDDLARILSAVIQRGICGVFNLAGDGVATTEAGGADFAAPTAVRLLP